MNTGISRHYKTLTAVALVAGPLIWLLFTQDGQRRTDLVLMPLLGRPSIELSLTDLSSDLGEGDVRRRVPQVDLGCSQYGTPFGDRICSARIGAIGRLPAEALNFYFSSGELRAVKLVYRRDVQGELLASLSRQLGSLHEPRDVHELHGGWNDLLGVDHLGQDAEPTVGNGHDSDIGFDRGEGIVRGIDLILCQGREQRRLANVGQTNDTDGQSHELAPFSRSQASNPPTPAV